jgi:hypothetical protein
LNLFRRFAAEHSRPKKEPDKNCPACFQLLGNVYGAFVLGIAGAFVLAGVAGALLSELLQPVNTALKAMPNSTTKDSFFIGRRNFYCSSEKHK